MRAARFFTCGDTARCAAILDIALAWAWCGIMAWAKLISAWLWSWATDGALVAVPEGAVVLVRQPPSAASKVQSAAITRIKGVLVAVLEVVLLCVQVFCII